MVTEKKSQRGPTPAGEPPRDASATDWTVRPFEELELIGGELALDFANSLGGTREVPKERLHAYSDLVGWAVHAGGIEPAELEPLLAQAAERPDEAARVLERALELREAIYRIFTAVSEDRRPAPDDLERLNQELARALPHLRIATCAEDAAGQPFEYGFGADPSALDRPLWPIARSAADLLAEGELARVKQCTSDDCAWLFVDLSKNKSRRWCDMKDCGNRAKARRHYHRQKRAAG